MYHERRAVERIVAAEIMKLERRQAMERAKSYAMSDAARSPGRTSPAQRAPGSGSRAVR